MKTKLLFAFASLVLTSAYGEIALRGEVKNGGSYFLSLSDSDTKESRWVALGSTFSGFRVVSYDSEKATATLQNGTSLLLVTLRDSHVADGVNTVTPDSRVGSGSTKVADIADMTDSEMEKLGLYKLKPGDTLSSIAKSHNTTPDILRSLNPDLNFARLRVGQIVVLSADPDKPNQAPEPTPPSRRGSP